MVLTNGSQLGSYEIQAPLGSGGMGEVYRARDRKLGRAVALKLLRPELAGDPGRLARFEREAKLLASLNHPNIAALYGFEEAADVRFLVMELIEGETLAERLAGGPLAVPEALQIGGEIARAVEAAHDKGIIHRDLKPGNVKITRDGRVKVLDFGLAKAIEVEPTGPEGADLSTDSYQPTREGVIMGTPSYMSPEQARGKPLDRRTDVWSFGCVLYEMLTGRPAFTGETPSDILAAVLGREPDWSALPAETPISIRHILTRCLRKELDRRPRDIGDVRVELEESLAGSEKNGDMETVTQILTPAANGNQRARLALLVAGGVALGLLFGGCGGWLLFGTKKAATSPAGGFPIGTPAKSMPAPRQEALPPNSLAVLPFELPSDRARPAEAPRGALEEFRDTLAASITKTLSQTPKLKVAAQSRVTWALAFTDAKLNPSLLSRQLNARVFLTGKVRTEPGSLVVQVELIEAQGGRQLWGEVYREKLDYTKLAEAEQKLAKEIAQKVKDKLIEWEE